MNNFVEMICSNGMSVVVIAYLLFSDYKFNTNLSKSLESINATLEILKERG